MTKVSYIYLSKNLLGGSPDGLGFKLLHEQAGNNGTNGGTHGSTKDLLDLSWKRK